MNDWVVRLIKSYWWVIDGAVVGINCGAAVNDFAVRLIKSCWWIDVFALVVIVCRVMVNDFEKNLLNLDSLRSLFISLIKQ